MDASIALDGAFKTVPWLLVAFFAKRSLDRLEHQMHELDLVLTRINTKLEVLCAVVNNLKSDTDKQSNTIEGLRRKIGNADRTN